MSYTPTTWQTGDTITAAGLNKIENGIAAAGNSGGWDLVGKMSTLVPMTVSTFTVISGDTAANLYDKLMDGNPVTVLINGFNLSGGYANSHPWECFVYTTSVPDTIFIQGISTLDYVWPSWATLQYDSNGISWA